MDKYLKMADVFGLPVSDEVYRVDFAVISDSNDHMIGGFGIEGMSHHAAHAINSHDELVAEVERLRESLKWAVGNLPFENAFEWSDDENADAHYAALRLLCVEIEE